MPFHWSKYIDLGRELKKNDTQEYLRSSISRGYYGLFNILRIAEGITTKQRPHEAVIQKYSASDDDDKRTLGYNLKNLREFRNDADYDGIKPVDAIICKRFWIELDGALDLLEEIKTK